tara:strand:- start:3224 stop:3604 length:381 start_codon:yes stop_codon:yes gene_type:complete
MKLMTKEIENKLIKQHKESVSNCEVDWSKKHKPWLKLFCGSFNVTCAWLLSEYNPDTGIFFGLCDLGLGLPEMGYVSLDELKNFAPPPPKKPQIFYPFVKRDKFFVPNSPLWHYYIVAKEEKRIIA